MCEQSLFSNFQRSCYKRRASSTTFCTPTGGIEIGIFPRQNRLKIFSLKSQHFQFWHSSLIARYVIEILESAEDPVCLLKMRNMFLQIRLFSKNIKKISWVHAMVINLKWENVEQNTTIFWAAFPILLYSIVRPYWI